MQEKIRLLKPPVIDEKQTTNLLIDYLAGNHRAEIDKMFRKISNEDYFYWDKARFYLKESELSPGDLWYVIRNIRRISSVSTPIKTETGATFTWYRPIYTDKFLREIDMYTGGAFLTEKTVAAQEKERQKYLTRGIVEESIASSQLEGADTASKYAKKMITENIRPHTKGERMIMNNYKVMKKIENEYKDRTLSIPLLQIMQSELTEGTLDEQYVPGDLRKDEDDIIVQYDEKIAHVPPSAAFVRRELERLVKYANDDSDFVHPVLKAIQLHFWIGYLHPFPDGNGRIARNVFYWYLFRHDYWAIGYLPISTILKRAPKKYTYSYIYAEQDDHDFTYFFDYNIRCILKSIKVFDAHVEKRIVENEKIGSAIRQKMPELNQRQVYTLKFLLGDARAYTSRNSYSVMHSVSPKTAFRDLKMLLTLGLVRSANEGKQVVYYATDRAAELFS